MTLHPYESLQKLIRIRSYLEHQREELKFYKRSRLGLPKAIQLINAAIKDLKAQYYIVCRQLLHAIVWIAEDRNTDNVYVIVFARNNDLFKATVL